MKEREALWKQVISRKYGVEEGVGILGRGEKGLVWLWKEIRKEGSLWGNKLCSPWIMVEELDFGKINGVRMRLCVTLSLLCMLWQYPKRSGWQRCGTLR